MGPPAEIMTEDGGMLASATFGSSGSDVRGSDVRGSDVTSAVRVWLITMRSLEPYRSSSRSSCSCSLPLPVLTIERVQPEP